MSITESTSARVRPMTSEDLKLVLSWRNHPEVSRYMFTQHEISLDEHTRWFERSSQDPSYHLLIFEYEGISSGVVNFQQISPARLADWGFYVAPNAPKGTGRLLGKTALNYAFNDADLHKVCGQALAYNERSINFHQHLGFKTEGILREQHFDGQRYQDVVCFGLLDIEWASNS